MLDVNRCTRKASLETIPVKFSQWHNKLVNLAHSETNKD